MKPRFTVIIVALALLAGYFLFASSKTSAPTIDQTDDSAMMENDDTMTTPDLPDTMTYELETDGSTLTYSSERIVGNSHTGTVAISSGSLVREDGMFTGGEFTVDMTTITESKDNKMFLGHLASKDFFDVETYPTSSFVATSVTEGTDGAYTITGDLTILDQTHEITFPATLTEDGDGFDVNAEFDIDRTRWGVTYDSGTIFQQIGEKAIRDEVHFVLDLSFAPSGDDMMTGDEAMDNGEAMTEDDTL